MFYAEALPRRDLACFAPGRIADSGLCRDLPTAYEPTSIVWKGGSALSATGATPIRKFPKTFPVSESTGL